MFSIVNYCVLLIFFYLLFFFSPGEDAESDPDDFIVDDQGRPQTKQRKKHMFDDEGMENARDIFGVDFDYGEFEHYGGEFC